MGLDWVGYGVRGTGSPFGLVCFGYDIGFAVWVAGNLYATLDKVVCGRNQQMASGQPAANHVGDNFVVPLAPSCWARLRVR